MLADAATAFNGKLYVHGGGWDSLMVRQFPAAHPSMALVALLSAEATEAPGTGELRVQLVDEDGNDTGVGAAAAMGLGLSPLHRPGQRALLQSRFHSMESGLRSQVHTNFACSGTDNLWLQRSPSLCRLLHR